MDEKNTFDFTVYLRNALLRLSLLFKYPQAPFSWGWGRTSGETKKAKRKVEREGGRNSLVCLSHCMLSRGPRNSL